VIALENPSKDDAEKVVLLKIEDEMIAKFCELTGGMEIAMPIIRKQYDKLNIDFKEPTKEDLLKIAETLTDVTLRIKGELIAREESRYFRELFKKLDVQIKDLDFE
jgi:hypothetical protein